MTKEIQKALCEWLMLEGHESLCENYSHIWEMDVASITKAGMLHEFEVKISRSDFLAEKKKSGKFEYQELKHPFYSPNYFHYVCPEGLISINEIRPHMGLIFYSAENGITVARWGKRIHSAKKDREKILHGMLRLSTERKYFGCSLLTKRDRDDKLRQADYLKNIHQS